MLPASARPDQHRAGPTWQRRRRDHRCHRHQPPPDPGRPDRPGRPRHRRVVGPREPIRPVLAAHGADVVAAARRTDRLESLARDIEAAGGRCHPVALDVTDADRLLTVLDDAETRVRHGDDPGQQRRDPRRATGAQDERRADRPGARHQPARAVHPRRRLRPPPDRGRAAGADRQHLVDGGVHLRRQRRRAVLDHQDGDQPDDRDAGRRVGPLSHQRQRHRARRVLLRDDGRDAGADGRHHQALPPASGSASPSRWTRRCCTCATRPRPW